MSYIEGENKIRRWKISWDLVETLKKKKLRPDERFCEESRRICSKRENVRPRNRVTRWEGLALGAPISRNVGKVPARHDLSGSMCNKKIYGCEVLRAVIFFFFFQVHWSFYRESLYFSQFSLLYVFWHFIFFFFFIFYHSPTKLIDLSLEYGVRGENTFLPIGSTRYAAPSPCENIRADSFSVGMHTEFHPESEKTFLLFFLYQTFYITCNGGSVTIYSGDMMDR